MSDYVDEGLAYLVEVPVRRANGDIGYTTLVVVAQDEAGALLKAKVRTLTMDLDIRPDAEWKVG